MDFLQQAGTVTITSSSLVAIQTSGGVPIGIRVFDFAYAKTTTTAGSARFHNVLASGVTSEFPVVTIDNTNPSYSSSTGIRFPNGCYVLLAGGATATVNYMLEVT